MSAPPYIRTNDEDRNDHGRRIASRPYYHDKAYPQELRYPDSSRAGEAGTSYSTHSTPTDGANGRWSPVQSRIPGGAAERDHHVDQLRASWSPEEQQRVEAPSGLPRAPRSELLEDDMSPQAALSEISARLRTEPEKGATPDGFAKVRNGKRYQLVVVQHPNRARMCGFGHKDRRPLSPTLIVKLIVTDEATGAEVSPLEINTSLFLLATDLCHPDSLMVAPRNILVHHHGSTTAPAISGGHGVPPPRPGPGPRSPGEGESLRCGPPGSYGAPRRNGQGEAGEGTCEQLPSISSLDLPGRASVCTETSQESLSSQRAYERGFGSTGSSVFGGNSLIPGPAESYTRNLVGAAVASASVLKDESDKWSIFFVFQDISVRTEGVYRIKLMFANLEVNGRVGTGVSEALSETYTEPFTVYSPRRFPGMLDPTPLSRKLASQGIKIPVRNDKKKQKRRAEDGGAVVDDDDQDLDDNDDE